MMAQLGLGGDGATTLRAHGGPPVRTHRHLTAAQGEQIQSESLASAHVFGIVLSFLVKGLVGCGLPRRDLSKEETTWLKGPFLNLGGGIQASWLLGRTSPRTWSRSPRHGRAVEKALSVRRGVGHKARGSCRPGYSEQDRYALGSACRRHTNTHIPGRRMHEAHIGSSYRGHALDGRTWGTQPRRTLDARGALGTLVGRALPQCTPRSKRPLATRLCTKLGATCHLRDWARTRARRR